MRESERGKKAREEGKLEGRKVRTDGGRGENVGKGGEGKK